MQTNVPLFRLFGIQFTASWSWLFLFGLIWYAAEAALALMLPGTDQQLRWALATLATGLAVVSLYAHELGHALTAIRFGVPVKTISLFLLGGMAHLTRESPSPGAELLIALAGPAVSLAFGLVGLILGWLVWGSAPIVGAIGFWLALVNLPVAVFNLVPAYPLDGGRVLRGALWYAGQDLPWASGIAARAGQLGAVGLLFAGIYGLFTRSTGAVSGLWLVLLAWFMYSGAIATHRATVLMERLGRLSVASVMQRQLGRVNAGTTLQTFAEDHLLVPAGAQGSLPSRSFGVYRDEHMVGLVDVQLLQRVPSPLWRETTVERVMVPLGSTPSLAPGTSALRALQILIDEGWELLPVMLEERVLGLVTRADLARAMEPQKRR